MANDIEITVSGVSKFGTTASAINRALATLKRNADQASHELIRTFASVAGSADLAGLAMTRLSSQVSNLNRQAGGVKQLDEQLAAVGRQADPVKETGEQVGGVGEKARTSKPAVDALGRALAGTSHDGDRLAEAMEKVRARHAMLLAQLDATGDATLVPKIRESESTLRNLEKFSHQLEAAKQGTMAFIQVLENVPKVVGGVMSKLGSGGPYVIAGAAAIAAVFSTAIGAAISGALLGALGGGALALAVKGALSSPQVTSEFEAFKTSLSATLSSISVPFQGPLINALRDIDDVISDLDLSGAFAPLAYSIAPITDSLSKMANEAMPGLRKAFAAAAPFLAEVAESFPALGRGIDSLADSLAEAGPGAGKFFNVLITMTSGVIAFVGDMIEALSKAYEWVAKFGEWIGLYDFDDDAMQMMVTSANETAAAIGGAAEAAADLAEAQEWAKETATALGDSMRSQFDALFTFEEGIDALTQSIKDNGTSLDVTNEKGRNNIDVLRGMIDAAGAAGEAATAAAEAEGNYAGAQEAGAAARDAYLQQIRAQAAALGFDKTQVDALITSLGGLPTGTAVFDYRINVSLYGTARAMDAMLAVASGKTGGMTQSQINNAGRLLDKGRAAGGPVEAGQPYIVGEGGKPELFIPETNGTISPSVPASRSGTPAQTGAQTVINNYVTIQALDPKTAAKAVGDALIEFVRITGPLPARMVAA